MNPVLEVVWNGAKERAGEAVGLSSPLIGSTAQMCAAEAPPDLFGLVTPRRMPSTGTCYSCHRRFRRKKTERVCASCFTRIHESSVWK